MNLSKKRLPMTALGIGAPAALAAGLVAAACGMVPPPEYHVVAEAETLEVDLGPIHDAGVLSEEDSDAGSQPETAVLELGVGLATIPAISLSELLGKQRESIEVILAPVEGETREERRALKEAEKLGWVRYTEYLKIRYTDDDFAIEMVQKVPDDVNCPQAAIWMGFRGAKAPDEKDGVCTWADGVLGDGLSGSLDEESRMFTAVLEDIQVPDESDEKPLPTAD